MKSLLFEALSNGSTFLGHSALWTDLVQHFLANSIETANEIVNCNGPEDCDSNISPADKFWGDFQKAIRIYSKVQNMV